MLNKKSYMQWSWILMITFFIAGIYNYYFGLLGIVCMILPIYHAFKGDGRIHCSHYCPRGSLFGRFLGKISINRPLPGFFRSSIFKNGLLVLMMTMFTLAIIHAHGDPEKIGFAVLRFMVVSSLIGAAMGIFFKPRSWCQVCPMGHATGIIKDLKETKVK